MKYQTLEFRREGAVGVLTINRPQALNALNSEVVRELKAFVSDAAEMKDLRALIVTGQGEKAFVAGADIKEMQERNPATAYEMAAEGQRVFQALEDLSIPSIAAVNGFALGGGLELAMSCDFIVASKSAKMGLPEVSLGLIPGYGGTQRLARYCGKGIARLMALTGDIFTSEQCAAWGLVAMVVEPSELMPVCLKMAQTIAKRGPKAVALAKQSVNRGFDQSQIEGLKLEAHLFSDAFNTKDREEGLQAFVEKRAPNFIGQ